METSLMVDDYPVPPEIEEKELNIEIKLTFNFTESFPKKLSNDEIISMIKENLLDYIDLNDYEEIEIDI